MFVVALVSFVIGACSEPAEIAPAASTTREPIVVESTSAEASARPSAETPALTRSSTATTSATPPNVDLSPCEDLVPGKKPSVLAPTLPPHLATRGLGFDTSTPAPMKTLKEAGLQFAYIQAAIGLKKNRDFRANFDMAKRCALPHGAYQFISQGTDGRALAKTFLEVVGDDAGDLVPTLDLEKPPSCKDDCCDEPCSAWTGRVDAWLDEVETRTKKPAMVYLVEPFFTKCVCANPKWKARPLWLAAWPLFDFPKKPRVGGFDRWAIYQFEGNVLRFGGVIDLDVLGEAGLAPFTR